MKNLRCSTNQMIGCSNILDLLFLMWNCYLKNTLFVWSSKNHRFSHAFCCGWNPPEWNRRFLCSDKLWVVAKLLGRCMARFTSAVPSGLAFHAENDRRFEVWNPWILFRDHGGLVVAGCRIDPLDFHESLLKWLQTDLRILIHFRCMRNHMNHMIDFICMSSIISIIIIYPFAFCLVYCKTSGLQWFHHSSWQAPFWDQSALCQELAKRRELLPQAPLRRTRNMRFRLGMRWWFIGGMDVLGRISKYCVLPWKSKTKGGLTLGWSIQRIPFYYYQWTKSGLQGLPGLRMSCHSKAVEVYALEIQMCSSPR